MSFRFLSRAILALSIAGLIGNGAIAQDATDSNNGSAFRASSTQMGASTRLEAFLRQSGAVVVEGFTDVGTVSSEDQGAVRVIAVELTNLSNQQKLQGIGVEVHHDATGANEQVRTAMSFVDADEIETLIAALDTIQHVDPNITTLGAFNARYRTHGDLEIQNSETAGTRNVAIRATQILQPSGEITWATAIMPLARLADVRAQLLAAKQLLEKAGK